MEIITEIQNSSSRSTINSEFVENVQKVKVSQFFSINSFSRLVREGGTQAMASLIGDEASR
jgi:hypothetical protein